MRTLLLKALAAASVLLLAAALATYVFLRRSLPVVDGDIQVAGATGPIEIVRDADAIPHIFARTRRDALFGLGFVHAQDRLWQMEFQRRIGAGRLSEIFGAATIPQDRFLRTVGFGRAARAAWERLSPDVKADVNAYVAGVNAFLAQHRTRPPEFALLRFDPEPWTGPDVVVWQKMMAWDLSANYSWELLRHDLLAKVGAERMAELMPAYATDGLSVLSERDMPWLALRASAAPARAPVAQHFDTSAAQRFRPANSATAFTDALTPGNPAVAELLSGPARAEAIGSNNWVADGTLTASGKPLLANDPHLAARIPSIWYLAHMSAGDFDVIGATLPGTPVVALGRNRRIAWGATNVVADVQDLYHETLDDSGRLAAFRGAQEPLTILPETIAVKGGAPVRIEVRISRHGPIVSDAINANNAESKRSPKPAPLEPLAFRWTALDPDDTTIQAMLLVNEARSWDDFTAALKTFVVPSQNFVYADVDGHIGYYAPGRIPIRTRGDGSVPVDGASGEFEWNGWIDFDRLPHTFDPPEHFIVTANHRPVPASYPYTISVEWIEPFRGQRITDLIRNAGRLTPDTFAAIQADTISLEAKALLPLLLSHAQPQGDADSRALAILRAWDGDTRGDSAAAAIFEAWFHRLAPALAGDELGPLATDAYQGRFSYVTRFVANTLTGGNSRWCDDVRTPKTESCDETVSAALHDAVLQLSAPLGRDMSRWRWADAHPVVFPHQGLDSVGALRPFLSRTLPSSGDWSTVDVGPVAADRPFEQHNIASYREIVDLSVANDNRFIDAVGQSGHPLSPHYADFLPDWRAVKYRRMRMDREEIERGATAHLRLVPPK
jgi:penicillin amidase